MRKAIVMRAARPWGSWLVALSAGNGGGDYRAFQFGTQARNAEGKARISVPTSYCERICGEP